ncbi:MAG: YjgP/YjgQ family permease [Saprospiraceae bacterium]|nr:YjgP/YjgQ family permease [Saprospiraceae bacterium]
MKIIDRYILKKFLSAFFFIMLLLVLIIVVIDITEKIESFNKADLTILQIAGFYMDYIPWLANTITPITVFIATVFITAKMASHTEIIAILSNGMSFTRFLMPYMLGAFLIAVVTFYFTGWVIPEANKSRVEFEIKYLKNQFYFSERDNHFQEGPGVFTYVKSFTNSSNTGYNFTLERFDQNKLVEKLSSSNIKWDEEKEQWTLNEWQRRKITGQGEIINSGSKLDTALRMHPEDFTSDFRLNEALTIPELDAKIRDLQFRGLDGYEIYQIEKYIRITYPFTIIILTFIGVIVSARKARGGTGFQMALGFVIAFVFIIFWVMSKSMAEGGSMNPVLAVWLPNISFSLIGLLLYKTVPR